MPSVNLDLDYFIHPKTTDLMARLQDDKADVYPLRLIVHVGKFYPITGTITGKTHAEIEYRIGWRGEPGRLVQAMADLGFIEIDGSDVHVHEWEEWQGHLRAFKERSIKANKARWGMIGGNDSADSCHPTRTPYDARKESPHHTILTNHTNPTNQGADGLVDFLLGKGLGKTKAVELSAIPNLTTAHVQSVWDEIETKADIKSKPGYLAKKLIGCQWITIKKIDPRQVCKWCNAGMVAEINGVKVPSAGVKQNASGINWEGGKIPSEKLTPENIKLTTGKAAQ